MTRRKYEFWWCTFMPCTFNSSCTDLYWTVTTDGLVTSLIIFHSDKCLYGLRFFIKSLCIKFPPFPLAIRGVGSLDSRRCRGGPCVLGVHRWLGWWGLWWQFAWEWTRSGQKMCLYVSWLLCAWHQRSAAQSAWNTRKKEKEHKLQVIKRIVQAKL